MPPGRASTRHVSSNTVCFNPPWASAQTWHRQGTSPAGGRRLRVPLREPTPGLKNTPQSPSWWGTAELASLRAVLEMCPQQRRSTALPWSLHLAGKGLSGSPLGQILPWVDPPRADSKDAGGISAGQRHLSSGSRQDQATGPQRSQLGHSPPSLRGKDADISGQGRGSPDAFTPAGEAVGGLFSSLPQSGCSQGRLCCQDKQPQTGKV